MKTLERTLTPAEQAVRNREWQAVQLRIAGNTLEETAHQMGIRSPSGPVIVTRLVKRWRERNQVSLDERRLLDLDRVDQVWKILMEAIDRKSPDAIRLAKEFLFVSQVIYGRQAPAVQVNVNVDATALRDQRWAEIRDTPVGQLLASPDAFADPDVVEGEFRDGTGTRADSAGATVGADDAGAGRADPAAAGADGGADPAAASSGAAAQGGVVDPGTGQRDGAGPTVRKPRFPHLHAGLSAAVRGRDDRDE